METSIDLNNPVQTLRLTVRGEDQVSVYHDGNLVTALPAGTQRLSGIFAQGVVTLKSKKPFNVDHRRTGDNPEDMTSEPLPDPRREMNILAQMRAEFRRQLGVIREPFDTDAPWPGYEIDDDQETIFEEEELSRAQPADEKSAVEAPAESTGEKSPETQPEEKTTKNTNS